MVSIPLMWWHHVIMKHIRHVMYKHTCIPFSVLRRHWCQKRLYSANGSQRITSGYLAYHVGLIPCTPHVFFPGTIPTHQVSDVSQNPSTVGTIEIPAIPVIFFGIPASQGMWLKLCSSTQYGGIEKWMSPAYPDTKSSGLCRLGFPLTVLT